MKWRYFLSRFKYRRRGLNSNYRIGYKIIVTMMVENNNVFLAGSDALVYLGEPMHKKYFTKFVWGHSFSMHASYEQFFNSPSPVRTCTHFG